MSMALRFRAPLARLRRRFPTAYWRARTVVARGEWWLRRHGIGRDDAYDDAFWDFHETGDWPAFGALVLRHWPVRSIVDVGCGHGLALDGLRRAAPSLRLRGYDASPTAIARARAHGLDVDPLDVAALSAAGAATLAAAVSAFDLTLCLEVAEHVPPRHLDKLLTIVTAAPRLLFSAAHPNQGGRLHVNEQPFGYWVDRLAARGFAPSAIDEALRADLQALPLAPWYKENLHAFERRRAGGDAG